MQERSREGGAIAERPTSQGSFKALTILLVEDEGFVRQVTGKVLQSEGYRVLSTGTAAEAERKFRRDADGIDLLLTDVVLPDRDGLTLANDLRTIRPRLKTIFMSGYPENSVTQNGLHKQEEVYLHKPFSTGFLIGKIRLVSQKGVRTANGEEDTLATESATGTVSDSQRVALDDEYTSIKAEINSIGSTTNYNGGQVFTANTLNVFLSDGSATGNSTIGVTTGLLSPTSLSLGGATSATATLTNTAAVPAASATATLTGGTFVGSAPATTTLTAGGTVTAADTVLIGGTTYTFVASLTGAANQVLIGTGNTSALLNLQSAVNGTAGAGTTYGTGTVANGSVVASGASASTLTFTAKLPGTAGNAITSTTGTPANEAFTAGTLAGGTTGDTVDVAGQTYTFVTALVAGGAANQVLVGNEATSLANLAAAVNLTSGGAGVTYGTGTTANASASATATTTTATFTAITAGTAGNVLVSTLTGGVGSFAAGTFAGGAAAIGAGVAAAGNTVTVGTQTYTFVAALNPTPTANEVLVGTTEAASLTNLANAVNGGSGSGATYGSPTVANTSATAIATATTVAFTAINNGTTGNAIVSTETGSGNTFAAGTFAGGAAGSVNDLLSQPDAQSALQTINAAVATVAALRGAIGATVNRLQSASDVITNQVQNLTAAENDVTAADIPTAVANLTQYSILEQTGISALAQANQQQQLVLKLLQ